MPTPPPGERNAGQGTNPIDRLSHTDRTVANNLSTAFTGLLCAEIIVNRTFHKLNADDAQKFQAHTTQAAEYPKDGTEAYARSTLATIAFFDGAQRFLLNPGTRGFLERAGTEASTMWKDALLTVAGLSPTAQGQTESMDVQTKRATVEAFAEVSWEERHNPAGLDDVVTGASQDYPVIWAGTPKPGEQAAGFLGEVFSEAGSAQLVKQLESLGGKYDPDLGQHSARRSS